MNLVNEEQLTAATLHEAIQSNMSQFNMVDEGEVISIRNSEGLSMLTLPANEETRDFYSDKLITSKEYLARGGHFSKWRRAIINGDHYYMETFDEQTGETVKLTEIDSISDDLSNNHNLTMGDLIDFVKVVCGDNIVELPNFAQDSLSYYDMKTENVITGSPVQILSSALQSAGFKDEQIDKLFEGTRFEDADKKAARIARLEDTDAELASDQFRDVKYYDAVNVNGELDLRRMTEMKPSEVSQTIIDRYSTFVRGYLDADEKIDQFTAMLASYTKDCTDEENEIKLAKIIYILDSAEDGTIKNVRRNHDKRVDKMFGKNGIAHEIKKGNKYDQFTTAMEDKIDSQLEYVDDVQTKFERLQNAEQEAMDYVNEGVQRGSLKVEHYDAYVSKQIKSIEEACEGATEDAVYDAWEELDRLEKTKREMEDNKFLDFVIDECEFRERQTAKEETARLNGEWFLDDEEDIADKYGAVRELDDAVSSEPRMVAESIDSSEFFGGDTTTIVSSGELDDILTAASATYTIQNEKEKEQEVQIEEDEDFDMLDMDDLDI